MDFDALELQILSKPAASLQLATAIKKSEEKLLSVLFDSLSKYLGTHLGDSCHTEVGPEGVSLFRKDLLVNYTEFDKETQENIYSYSDSNFQFVVSLHSDVTAWSLLEKRKIKGASDIDVSFVTTSPDDLNTVLNEIDKILLPTTYKRRKHYGEIVYVLQRKIYISSESLLDDLINGRMESYFDPILSALSGFHRMPWDNLKTISDKMEAERSDGEDVPDEL